MEELNKTQLILLALLVSFVTSSATGIVTVALMDQAPPAITQTINRVVKETERVIVPAKQQAAVETVVVKEEDYIVSAVDANLPNVVTIAVLEKRKSRLGFTSASDTTRRVTEVGIGFVLTKDGIVALPGALFDKGEEFALGTQTGEYYALAALLKDTASGIALAQVGKPFVAAEKAKDESPDENAMVIDLAKENDKTSAASFADAKFADSEKIKLGQTAVALGIFSAEPRIILGTISGFGFGEASGATEKHLAVLYTTIAAEPLYNGGPLLDSAGSLMGVTLFGAGQTGTAVSSDVAKTLLAKVIEKKETEKSPNSPNIEH